MAGAGERFRVPFLPRNGVLAVQRKIRRGMLRELIDLGGLRKTGAAPQCVGDSEEDK